jgi:type IV pilus assembly protein PilA
MNKIKAGFTLIELMIVVAIIGLLAALAIPNFIKFQARSRQSEVKSNLKASYTAQKSFYGDKNMFLDDASIIGFSPEYNNRYGYFFGGGGSQRRNIAGSNATPTVAASVNCAANYAGSGGVIGYDENKYGPSGSSTQVWNSYVGAIYSTRVVNTGGAAAAAVYGVTQPGQCCPSGVCEFLVAAEGNVDNDTTLDDWTIGSQGGTSTANGCNVGGNWTTSIFAEGEPVNECNDVSVP